LRNTCGAEWPIFGGNRLKKYPFCAAGIYAFANGFRNCTGRSFSVARWDRLQIFLVIDGEGQPPNDFMALREEALSRGTERGIDPTVTRTVVVGAFPKPRAADKIWIKTCARCWLWCRRP
jgi:hypothetical protein